MEQHGHGHAQSHAIDIDKQVRRYMVVFVSLLALTVVTVGVSYLHLPVGQAVTLALVIACFKASLVFLFFMHLIDEKRVIYIVLAFTVAFFLVLLFLPILTNLNPITL